MVKKKKRVARHAIKRQTLALFSSLGMRVRSPLHKVIRMKVSCLVTEPEVHLQKQETGVGEITRSRSDEACKGRD